jgi:hypothetical protein
LVYDSSGCLTVTDSLFVSLSEWQGGAIWTGSLVTDAIIQDSSFHSCSSLSGTDAVGGGAINHDGGTLNITRCCGINCSASMYGNFVRFSKSGTSHVISHLSMISHGTAYDFSGVSGICCEPNVGLELFFINSSFCATRSYGSVVCSMGGIGDSGVLYSLLYVNAVNCSGGSSTVDNSRLLPDCSVTLCNFYMNSASLGVVATSSPSLSLSIDHCIFKDNIGNRDLYLYGTTAKLQVSNCIFSAPSIPSSYADDLSGNSFDSFTQSRCH